jgi:hypothetical protein
VDPVTWPPSIEGDLKDDLDIPADDTIDDAKLKRRLDASVSFVERVRVDAFAHEEGEDGELVPVEPREFPEGSREAHSIVLGTLMLTARLFARRRSPDVILWMAETGTTRLPFEDRDIDRLLRIGRSARPKVA